MTRVVIAELVHLALQLNSKRFCLRSAGAAVLAAVTFSITPGFIASAEAKSHICVKIESELAAYSSGRVASAEQRKNVGLSKRMKLLGCTAQPSFFGPRQHKACPTLRGQKRASDRRLTRAESDKGKKQLERLHQRNNCGTTTAKKKPVSILERLFGSTRSAPLAERKVVVLGREPVQSRKRVRIKRTVRKTFSDKPVEEKQLQTTSISSYGKAKVRSLCVRTCDGYAFPVSFSTRTKNLEKDAEACADLCPGREMQLYFHRASNESMAQSISYADGTDYAAMPRAFAFKQKFDPNCSCNHRLVKREAPQIATPLFNKKALKKKKKLAVEQVSTRARPSWRPAAVQTISGDEKPIQVAAEETLANIDNHSDVKPAEIRPIRVVGEEFLPDR
ncbi:DUF2865 domain-containing protein [Ahrensia sp. R2A130]|uniref:DUF2865 domain-containing protein n=1 Tax=Ahrensia sp. R2A130 TaxID=744979 RepID=UPI0001E0E868|nr:DUF2865 domain-containing protein [Ahrensia sp. R2A130]EFL90398.1 conserved hypothetical protein [Ahrensia sp. R2A130]